MKNTLARISRSTQGEAEAEGIEEQEFQLVKRIIDTILNDNSILDKIVDRAADLSIAPFNAMGNHVLGVLKEHTDMLDSQAELLQGLEVVKIFAAMGLASLLAKEDRERNPSPVESVIDAEVEGNNRREQRYGPEDFGYDEDEYENQSKMDTDEGNKIIPMIGAAATGAILSTGSYAIGSRKWGTPSGGGSGGSGGVRGLGLPPILTGNPEFDGLPEWAKYFLILVAAMMLTAFFISLLIGVYRVLRRLINYLIDQNSEAKRARDKIKELMDGFDISALLALLLNLVKGLFSIFKSYIKNLWQYFKDKPELFGWSVLLMTSILKWLLPFSKLLAAILGFLLKYPLFSSFICVAGYICWPYLIKYLAGNSLAIKVHAFRKVKRPRSSLYVFV